MKGGKGKRRESGKLVHGVGINDAGYAVCPRVDGKIQWCPFYRVWSSMFYRCYSVSSQKKSPTYIGCAVAEEWHRFSNFKRWMEQQPWQGNQLDKDILVEGNKIYGPDNCCFVPLLVNTFLTDSKASRGKLPIGVSLYKALGKFGAHCHEGDTLTYLGVFSNAEDAHLAYRKHKEKLAIELASVQTDSRIAEALIKRYKVEEIK